MTHWRIKLSLLLNYFVFAILLNSVGTVILQVQNNYGVSESSASVLEAFKDLTIAAVSSWWPPISRELAINGPCY
jgi:cyanate permease